ncbi:hypothetical protein [Peribacillus sp. TH14]|uniref:hypothetical protein n=1 Tax=Peribacillus sp. TH14 TaxID=2798481 RepID=UPI0019141DF7|nr:hypothetical protein [Peribacillus sp. TH14]MBK5502235.1 hypothetical protein [Peribacillus sp. TH14]
MPIIEFPGNLENIYEKFVFLVDDIYQECLDSGYTESGATGKIKYELEPMAEDKYSKKILYLELSYYFADKELKESFRDVFEKFRNVIESGSVREFPNEIAVGDKYRREIDVKVRKIIRFYEQNFQDRHFG